MPRKALDLSNYSDVPTSDELLALKADGYDLAIIQAIDPPPGYPSGRTQAQIDAFLGVSIEVYAYLWLWDSGDMLGDLNRKLDLVARYSDDQVTGFVIDAEDTIADTVADRIARMHQAVDLIRSRRASLRFLAGYTGRWYWLSYMANTTEFSDLPLLDAHYFGDGHDQTTGFIPYGGWAAPWGLQWHGTTSLDGIANVDLDVVADPIVQTVAIADPRETPTDFPFADWQRSAIAYRGALDQVVPQYQSLQTALTPLRAALASADASLAAASLVSP